MRFQFEMRETQRTQHRRNNYPVVLMTEMGVYSVNHNNHEARFGSETVVVMYIYNQNYINVSYPSLLY